MRTLWLTMALKLPDASRRNATSVVAAQLSKYGVGVLSAQGRWGGLDCWPVHVDCGTPATHVAEAGVVDDGDKAVLADVRIV